MGDRMKRMDRTKVAQLISQLETAGSGWMGDAQREIAIRVLRSETDQDHGADVAAWKRWLGAVDEVGVDLPNAPLMSYERAQALSALRAMGVVDEGEFMESIEIEWEYSFKDLEDGLRHYLLNHRGSSLWLPSTMKAYGEQHTRERIVEDIKKLFGPGTRAEIETCQSSKAGFRMSLGGETRTITKHPLESMFVILHGYAASHGEGKRLVLDDQDRCWYLTAENIAAIRRNRSLRFRKLNPDAIGTAHPDVMQARSYWDSVGAVLALSSESIAWKVNEYSPEEAPRRYGYHTQLIDLADGGLPLMIEDFGRGISGKVFTKKLSKLVGHDLSIPRQHREISELIDDLNNQLNEKSSSWHIVVIRVGSAWCRVLPWPCDRVDRLSAVTECIAGHVNPPDRRSGMESFSLVTSPSGPKGRGHQS
jgi:hypothetical protein